MKTLGMKLISGFLLLLLMIIAVAFYSSFASQKSLQDAIGQSSVFVANEMLVNMNMAVFDWIDRFEVRSLDPFIQQAVEVSNRQFSAMGSPDVYMDRMEAEWRASAKGDLSPAVNKVVGSDLSEMLRNFYFKHYQKKQGSTDVAEIIVTNKYGATVAATEAASHYRFDGNALWLKAKESGSTAGEVELDEQSGQASIPLAVPVTDAQGQFSGAILVKVTTDSIIRNAVITYKKYESTQVRLTTTDGKLLYATKAFHFMEDVSAKPYFQNIKGDSGSFVATDGGRATLFSYSHSQGYLEFSGMPWILVVGNDVSEVLAPSFALRNNIIIASGILILLGILVAFLISRSITRPVVALKNAAAEITRGNLSRVIEVRGRDEVGMLARSFMEMQKALQGVAALAERIASGDLTVQAVKRSEEDSLGIALENMLENLRRIAAFAERIASGDLTVQSVKRSEEDSLGISLENMLENLRRIAAFAERIASGDLTVQSVKRSDEDSLGISLENMLENLRRQTREIQDGAGVIAAAASEIFTSTSQFASNSSETATAVSQTTTTIEEVKQTAHLSNEKAKQMADRARRTEEIAETGRVSVQDTTQVIGRIREQMDTIGESITRLSEQSASIGEIITTVSDLADQSNLLAVNAAIEAAKAGEQGRGFGVVAQEIKSLAEQSKRATAQVRSLLTEIQKATNGAVMATEQGSKAVEQGTKQAGEAKEAIESLAETVAEAAQGAAQIAASSQQQLVGMDQVAIAMESIKVASVQGVEGTRQLEMGAQNLHGVGQKMKQLVELYKM
ncbi:MAG: methyl-accepting chemotaxis protein [Spirochaetia bacterium]|jgi:methyl-accepting chemotaxis protein